MENHKMDYSPLWNRYLPMFEEAELTEQQVGKLTLTIMRFQARGTEPTDLDPMCRVFWSIIREDLRRAQLKYDKAVTNGKKGGRPRKEEAEKTKKNQEKPITESESKTKSESKSTTETESTSPPNSGSAPAREAGVCCEEKSHGEFGWVKLTDPQYERLLSQLGLPELQRCITYVDEAAQSTGNRNRWKDWYLILRRCHENHWYEVRQKSSGSDIPKGASGVFGEAELEAIARVLRE